MKYVAYFEDKDSSGDSIVCHSKKELLSNIKAVQNDTAVVPCKIVKICAVRKGEYVPADICPLPVYSVRWHK